MPVRRSAGDGLVWAPTILGRDVLSRVLWGGRTLVTLALVSTTLAYVGGGVIGLVAGMQRDAGRRRC